MIIAPETEIYLLKAPLEADELHQLDFANETAQVNYFQSLPKLALMSATYQRENNKMYVKFNLEQIRNYNYVMYKNKQYSNKWFYAFIIGMTYEGNTVTGVQIKTDVFQTYLFDYSWRKSYVKRETVNDDTFGKHIIPEPLNYGDYVLNTAYSDAESLITNSANYNQKSALIVLQCSERLGVCYTDETWTTEVEDMYIIGGLPQGCWYYMFYNTSDNLTALRALKKHLDSIGKGALIINIFLAPQQALDVSYCVLKLYDAQGSLSNNYCSTYVASSNTYLPKQLFSKTLTIPSKIGNFTPVNNKTLTFPYNYFLVSNNTGGVMDYHYEDFNGSPNFRCIGTLSVSTPFCLLPNNSKKSQNVEYGINTEMLMGTQLPCLSWDSDYYLNWIAQNGSTIRLKAEQFARGEVFNLISGVVGGGVKGGAEESQLGADSASVAGGMFGGATANTITGAISMAVSMHDYIANVENTISNAKAVPNTVNGNLGAGDLAYSIFGSVGYKFYNFQIRENMARKIDAYFSMYGYQVDEIKTPNTKTRSKWNFIQTVGANIVGDIPQEAIIELKNMFNAGITIWHDTAHFLDYDQSNTVV